MLKNMVFWTMIVGTLISFSFITVHAASTPKVTLKITRLDFANGYWNYRVDYTLRNLYDGSLKVNGAMFVNNITQNGSSETDYALKPGKKYTFIFYSKSGGKGRILASKVVVLPRASANKNISTPIPIYTPTPTPSNPLDTNKNPNWGSLNWIIVFTNAGEQIPETIKNDLCYGTSTNKFSYLPTWFKREANKYGISLSVSLKCYDQQVVLPQSAITTADTYYAFGKNIPIPLDKQKTSDYLMQTIPSLSSYDLITVVHYRASGDSVADLANIGKKVSYVFITKSNLIDGVQYYAPNVTEPNIEADPVLVKGTAHEALHGLRAQDHYNFDNFSCRDELDKSSQSPSIMCAANLNKFSDYIVSPQTAKEIGWTN